jgi:hypothetical protein
MLPPCWLVALITVLVAAAFFAGLNYQRSIDKDSHDRAATQHKPRQESAVEKWLWEHSPEAKRPEVRWMACAKMELATLRKQAGASLAESEVKELADQCAKECGVDLRNYETLITYQLFPKISQNYDNGSCAIMKW